VISTIALFVAIGGISWAAAKIGTSDIKNGAVTTKKLHNKAVASKKIKSNAVNSAKVKNDSLTGNDIDESTLSAPINVNHAAEADHAANADHANNADTADRANNVLSAVVVGGCTVSRATQSGVTATTASSMAPAASACNVDFSRDVTQCTYTATIGEADGGESSRGFITTAQTVGNPQSVFVRTTNIADTLAIRPFHLVVVC
jgi:hypothetical protein